MSDTKVQPAALRSHEKITEPIGRVPFYPLRFEPIYQYRLWGGRRLADLLTAPLPGDALSAKRGCSATALTIKAALPMDLSRGGPSLNSSRSFQKR